MSGRRERSGGFTVVELIVAMSISAITLLSGYEFFQTLKRVGDSQSANLAATAGIVHSLSRIHEDLLHAVPRTESREPVFVGANPALEGEVETTKLLEFYSLCVGYGGGPLRSLRQLHRVSYELVRVKDSVRLYRSAAPVVGAGQVSSSEDRGLILDRVEQIKIVFDNGETREPSFSSNEKLPAGVELTVTAYDQVWPLSVKLPCGTLEGQP